MKNHLFFVLAISIFLILALATPTLLSAQPPLLPDAPDQAPIDGGLALLAAGGGAYAIKKLSGKNKE